MTNNHSDMKYWSWMVAFLLSILFWSELAHLFIS
ncbi:MAG: hypothetical protein LBU96_04460 [Yokenella regensburgei]|nr:small membrane protein YmiC [Yokenella regensburgei]MDQ4431959.1 small membrane protein YmiC [Yokenella regensburgei]MDR3103681.1 hypothetical protein [Yokenella regensburgei]